MKTQSTKFALLILGIIAFQLATVANGKQVEGTAKVAKKEQSSDLGSDKIEVLNFGTFHMRETPDSFSVPFDPVAEKDAVHAIAKQLAEFKPTVIVVERVPEDDAEIQAEYEEYVKTPGMKFESVSEIQLLAYEIGRLSKATRIRGIDHKMNYNYGVGGSLKNAIDQETCIKFSQSLPKMLSKQNGLSTLERLKLFNTDEALNFSLLANADILAYIGTKEKFEGADEAARFYQRNLRMYSNLNRISLTKDDRVFILLGATHTAFMRDFLGRSPKYKLVDSLKFLK